MEKFTLEIIQDALVAAGDEMFKTLERTSMSPIIYESLDYAVGITDSKGELLAQGNGVTAFLAALDSVVRASLEKYNEKNPLKEGDVIIANTPYAGGGTHLSDVSVVYPVFYKGELVAFTVNKAHWTELGGTFPGSVSTVATEIYQEGLHFPFIKIKSEGVLNAAVIDMIKVNVRLPDSTLGDLFAGIAAAEVGAKRVISIIEKYGLDTYKKAKNDFLDYGERMCIEALKDIPNGVYEGESIIEDNGFGEGPFPIKAKITVTDTEFIADFNGSHPQVKGATNLAFSGLVTGCRSLFKAITTPRMDANGGAFRPMKVVCEPGTIVSAQTPSAVSVYYEVMVASIDLVWKILAPLIPNKLPAGHLRSVCATFISGVHPDTKQFYIQAEPLAGGWGASCDHDGNRGQLSCGSGESYNIPIEIREMRYGIQVDQYAFHNEGGGYGEYQGGNGQYVDYKIVSDGAHVTAAFLGEKTKTWGMKGGHDGSYNYFMIIRKDGTKERYSLGTNIYLEKGDIVRCVTATGGGYGNPKDRPREQVLLDIKNGYITQKEAQEFYKVS
ncbi:MULTISPECIES: hydantoinase B/oxoprolinase family protein [Flavobacteriaceae]|uniref:Hydantoinase B/oxoprolinase family protein n=2 Tax=Flagellimonas TaxID=444459 RepID=A0ABT5XRP9_9FLAO|nr:MULTISPECIES: hydantoinase B/oxoprolinase family protein [Flavobacteriaceae]MBO0356182.1 hydantoinase B/oxoprolinase family protein [Allomuricauda aurea]MDF0708569.1 hydantoinase B/oxoprolinase family protein [[Muricauda] okinawensis]